MTMAKAKRHPNSARFHEILKELGDLHDRKQADYGCGDDPFANLRATEQWCCPHCGTPIPAWLGALVRLSDKVARLQSFTRNSRLANEGVEDSMRDIPVYAAIALVLYEQSNEERR